MRRDTHVGRRAGRGRQGGAPDRRRGIVLIASVGVLGVIAVMGMAFAMVMRLEAHATRNFTMAVRAEFVAHSGIEDAIARLRAMARDGCEFPYIDGKPAPWYTWQGTSLGGGWKPSFPANAATNGIDDNDNGLVDGDDSTERSDDELGYSEWVSCTYVEGGDSYTLRVEDAASKINVNANDTLGTILDNLCRVIGPPLVAARQEALVPTWFPAAMDGHWDQSMRGAAAEYRNLKLNGEDKIGVYDLFYRADKDRPVTDESGRALYGDGYAIARYRARHGQFLTIEDVKAALTWVERGDGDDDGDLDGPEIDLPQERMEIENKFAAIRPYITVDSWTDTDQIGYGKFEQVRTHRAPVKYFDGTNMTVETASLPCAYELTDRNRTWNVRRNPDPKFPYPQNTIDGVIYAGELQGCLLAIVNNVGQGQLKTIRGNTIDTIVLDDYTTPGSELRIPPRVGEDASTYVIIGRDGRQDAGWRDALKFYARQPLSFHRAPVNVNTAAGKVLVSLLLGLQTNWGPAGLPMTIEKNRAKKVESLVGMGTNQCPTVVSVGRDALNGFMAFKHKCPNCGSSDPFGWFCSYGRLSERCGQSSAGLVNEAHYIAWQILKEREKTPFKGWDDLYFRVFRPWELDLKDELAVRPPTGTDDILPKPYQAAAAQMQGNIRRHPGVARLLMANFNSNPDILKFQPNIEWIDRWGANFTELYIPRPDLMTDNKDVKLRVRPGELLDKSDINVGTTEFSFDSGGIYEVRSTGRIYDEKSVVAEASYTTLVRIYDVWRESTQREFVAGSIMKAAGSQGTRLAGSVTVDQVLYRNDVVETGPVERKALITLPEPLVPGGFKQKDGTPAPLALGKGSSKVQPAGWDGQITLATNCLASSSAEGGAVANLSFFNGFTGGASAEVARGNADPTPMSYTNHTGDGPAVIERLPLDALGLMGKADDTWFDLQPQFDANGEIVEGEGCGGDFRADGVYLGVVGATVLDGSFLFETNLNMNRREGAFTAWIKPTWHHGTFMHASLPMNYQPDGKTERGSTQVIPPYIGWVLRNNQQDATNPSKRGATGYIRERFEHEFFSATKAGEGAYAQMWRMVKTGDWHNSVCDLDCPGGWLYPGENELTGRPDFSEIRTDLENEADQDFATRIPGYLHRDGRPFYQMCPFRWFFVGMAWNYYVPNRGTFSQWGHSKHGQARELYIHKGGFPGEAGYKKGWDSCFGYYGETGKDHPERQLSLWLTYHGWVDTMRIWQLTPDPASKDSGDNGQPYDAMDDRQQAGLDYEDYAWLYGGLYQWGAFPFGAGTAPASPPDFGVNKPGSRAPLVWTTAASGSHYQQSFSGTYATMDEYALYSRWPDRREDFKWPHQRRSMGRYYFPQSTAEEPWFLSQTLFASEEAQAPTFTADEGNDEIELGSVRWTVFTPYYCVDQPLDPYQHLGTVSGYRFPYDSYFRSLDGSSRHENRKSPQQLKAAGAGVTARESSQRGCRVQIMVRDRVFATADLVTEDFEDPAAWTPIMMERQSRAGASDFRHARSTPQDLRYKVFFRLSQKEYNDVKGKADMVLLDTPVFDDITITYMRRPKIIEWREVRE